MSRYKPSTQAEREEFARRGYSEPVESKLYPKPDLAQKGRCRACGAHLFWIAADDGLSVRNLLVQASGRPHICDKMRQQWTNEARRKQPETIRRVRGAVVDGPMQKPQAGSNARIV